MKKLTTDDFITKALEIHGNKYDYSKVIYDGANKKVVIICPLHGEFLQSPHGHLGKQKQECPRCYGRNKSTIEFISLANKIHRHKYDYSKTIYQKCMEKVSIICPTHGEFLQNAHNHLLGKGCSKCTSNISKPETDFLDYLNIPVRNYYIKHWKNKLVDGYDPKTNTIYEFLGDYWHGNPQRFNSKNIHPILKISYGKVFAETMNKLEKLKTLGYNIKYIWETDWKNFRKDKNSKLKIQEI